MPMHLRQHVWLSPVLTAATVLCALLQPKTLGSTTLWLDLGLAVFLLVFSLARMFGRDPRDALCASWWVGHTNTATVTNSAWAEWCRELAFPVSARPAHLPGERAAAWPLRQALGLDNARCVTLRSLAHSKARAWLMELLGVVVLAGLVLLKPSHAFTSIALGIAALGLFLSSFATRLSATLSLPPPSLLPRPTSRRCTDTKEHRRAAQWPCSDAQSLLEMGCGHMPRAVQALVLAAAQGNKLNHRKAGLTYTVLILLDQTAAVLLLM